MENKKITKMKRTQVFLPEYITEMLEAESEEFGISKGEIIRTALFDYYNKQEQ